MGVVNNPWDQLNPPHSAAFTVFVDWMREALESSPDQVELHVPLAEQWAVTIMVRVDGKFHHVTSVPMASIEQAMRAYRTLASAVLSCDFLSTPHPDIKVQLANTLGRAMAHADHQSYEHLEYVDHIEKRGGESLILGPIMLAVSRW